MVALPATTAVASANSAYFEQYQCVHGARILRWSWTGLVALLFIPTGPTSAVVELPARPAGTNAPADCSKHLHRYPLRQVPQCSSMSHRVQVHPQRFFFLPEPFPSNEAIAALLRSVLFMRRIRMNKRERLEYYSTVTDFARFRGWSTFVPRSTAT